MVASKSLSEVTIHLDNLQWGLFLTDLESWDEMARDQARFGDVSAGLSDAEREVATSLRAQAGKQLGDEFVKTVCEAANRMHRASTDEIQNEIGDLLSRRPEKEQLRTTPRIPARRPDTEPVATMRLSTERWGLYLSHLDTVDDLATENIDATGPTTRDLAKLSLETVKRVRRKDPGGVRAGAGCGHAGARRRPPPCRVRGNQEILGTGGQATRQEPPRTLTAP